MAPVPGDDVRSLFDIPSGVTYLNSAYINGSVPDTASVTVDAGTMG